MTDTIARRVARGAALLDEYEPGWWKLIDLGELDLRVCEVCVLGQVYGSYTAGLDNLGIDYGMAAESACGFEERSREYEPLTAEWRRVIEARRAS